MRKEERKISWWRLAQGFSILMLATQLWVGMQVFVLLNFPERYTMSSLFFNVIVYYFAMLGIANLIPKEFILKKEKK